MKNLLFIASRYPLPAHGGREQMILQVLGILTKHFQITFAYPSTKQSVPPLGFSNIELLEIPPPKVLNILKNLHKGFSIQESLFYSKTGQEIINEANRSARFEVVYTDMLRMSPYAEPFECFKVIDYDDLLSLRYERFSRSGISNISIAGSHTSRLDWPSKLISKLAPKKFFFRLEGTLIRKRELHVSDSNDILVFVSPLEAESFRKKLKELGKDKAIISQPPIYEPFASRVPRLGTKLLFIGNTETAQNLHTINSIVNNILPKLPDSFSLTIIGKRSPALEKTLSNRISTHEINVLGFVENIATEALNHDMLLAPIPFGTGIKLKVLQAFSLGIPVITNTIGSEGIPIKNKVHAIIADTNEEIVLACLEISQNKRLQLKLTTSAHKLLEDNFTSERVTTSLINMLANAKPSKATC